MFIFVSASAQSRPSRACWGRETKHSSYIAAPMSRQTSPAQPSSPAYLSNRSDTSVRSAALGTSGNKIRFSVTCLLACLSE